MTRTLLKVTIGLILSVILLEILLRFIDPWGAVTYFTVGGPTLDLYMPYGARDVLPEGVYHFPTWTAHINPDHTRRVPANGRGHCRIAFVGDSVTFGLGVDDAATWVNLLAAQHPTWDVVNAGVAGYNSYAVRLTIADTVADVYVYLITANDAEYQQFHPVVTTRRAYQPALQIYWRVWQIQQQGYEHPPQMIGAVRRFDSDLAVLAEYDNVLMAGFAADELAQSAHAQNAAVVLLAPYTETISFADPHPNPAGHQQIAAALEPSVIIDKHCPH
jgi:lysophospholipase L1-like esterase